MKRPIRLRHTLAKAAALGAVALALGPIAPALADTARAPATAPGADAAPPAASTPASTTDGTSAAEKDTLDAAPLGWPGGKRRYGALIYDPFTIAEARYGLTLQIVPASHHAIVLSPYYMTTNTNADSNNKFRGVGGEIGYKYFFGHDGPRGLHIGPSFLVGGFDGIPQNGPTVRFYSFGAALDIGWQATLFDRLVLGVAAGVQYAQSTVSIPVQELPAAIYANRGVHPRLQFAIGVTF
jgi:hypothetical protein